MKDTPLPISLKFIMVGFLFFVLTVLVDYLETFLIFDLAPLVYIFAMLGLGTMGFGFYHAYISYKKEQKE